MDLTVIKTRCLKRKTDLDSGEVENESSSSKSAKLHTDTNEPEKNPTDNICSVNDENPIDLSLSSQKSNEDEICGQDDKIVNLQARPPVDFMQDRAEDFNTESKSDTIPGGNDRPDLQTTFNLTCDTAVDLSCSSSIEVFNSDDNAVDLSTPLVVGKKGETAVDLSSNSPQNVCSKSSTSQAWLDSSGFFVQTESSKHEISGDKPTYVESCEQSQCQSEGRSELSETNDNTTRDETRAKKPTKASSKMQIDCVSNIKTEKKRGKKQESSEPEPVTDVSPNPTESADNSKTGHVSIESEKESSFPKDSSANKETKATDIPPNKNIGNAAENLTESVDEPSNLESTELGEAVIGTVLFDTILTQEERDRFAFISQELSILNTANQAATPLKSPENAPKETKLKNKRRLAAVKRAINSPRKAAASRGSSKTNSKRKKDEGERTLIKPSTSREIIEESESDSCGLEIDNAEDEINDDLEEKLEENALKNNLTAINVKNILHQVVTNEHVLEMVQNSLTADGEELRPAAYEPKMTRSKTKLWQAPEVFPWLVSPSKNSNKPTIMDMNFSDEEEDDDLYEPERELLSLQPTDSDADSIISSWMSDFGSPCPSTPTTPCAPSSVAVSETSQSKTDKKDSGSDSEIFQSPMNPPLPSKHHSNARHLGKKYQEAILKVDENDPENVAHRTRSKVALNDKSILELEASFIAPDITADMYDLDSDDPDYSSFLTGLLDFPAYIELKEPKDQVDDEANDPEYNYLAEYEEPDAEDFRNDRGTRITKKELNLLFEELLEAYGDGDEEDTNTKKKSVTKLDLHKLKPTLHPPTQIVNQIKISEQERAQIQDQMKKHVQLIAQVFILSSEKYRVSMRTMLNDLNGLSNIMPLGGQSAFKSSNLLSALTLLDQSLSPTMFLQDSETEKNTGSCENSLSPNSQKMTTRSSKCFLKKNRHIINEELTDELKDLFCSNETFCFRQLLPNCLFLPESIAAGRKLTFSECEDNLISLGLDQFSYIPKQKYRYKLISDHMLPTKTATQISIRVKNQVAKKVDNKLKVFTRRQRIPYLPPTTELNGIASEYPDWFKERTEMILQRLHRPRSYSVGSAENVSKEIQTILSSTVKDQKNRSAPTSPVNSPSETSTNNLLRVTSLSKAAQNILKYQQGEERSAKEKVWDNKECVSPLSAKFPSNTQGTALLTSKPRGFLALMPLASSSDGHIDSNSRKVNVILTPVKTTSPVAVRSPLVPTVHGKSNPAIPVTKGFGIIATSTITCVAPTILISKVSSLTRNSAQTTTTMSQGLVSCPGIIKMIPSAQVAPPTPDSAEGLPLPPRYSQSAPNLRSKPRTAMDIMSAVAPFLAVRAGYLAGLSGQTTPTKGRSPHQKFLEKTPPKQNKYLRNIFPSPHVSPSKQLILPYVAKNIRKNSPCRKRLNQQAKAILPKGFIIKQDIISPMKKAAYKVKNRACKVRKTRCLLPKPPRPSQKAVSSPNTEVINPEEMEVDIAYSEAGSECETVDSEPEIVDDSAKDDKCVSSKEKHSGTKMKPSQKLPVTPPPESADSQTEEEEGETTHLQELMAASSTIRHQVGLKKKLVLKDRRTKAQKHKDSTLAMLDPDLILTDPIRDDRDIAFAQAYLQSVQTALKDNPKQYQSFLQLLRDFGKSVRSPCDLYEDMKKVLQDHPDLVEDFSGFLLPEQAVQCGCYMANQQYHKVRSFLRKLEIYFEKHPSHFQKIIRTFSQSWRSPDELRSMLQPLLKGQQHLLGEFSQFFDDERPPESRQADFEEIDLCDSDGDENRYLDGFEEISLEDYVDHHGTNLCPCRCHNSKAAVPYFKRRKHCRSCGLKIVGGKIYFRSTGNNLIPAKVVYHDSFYMDDSRWSPEKEKKLLSEQIQTALTAVESTRGSSRPEKADSGLTCLVRKRIKPITLIRSDQPGGRFIALDDMDETQSAAPWMKKKFSESFNQIPDSATKTISMSDKQLGRLQDVQSSPGTAAITGLRSVDPVSTNSPVRNCGVADIGEDKVSPIDNSSPTDITKDRGAKLSLQPPSPGTSAMGVYEDSPPRNLPSVFPTNWPSFASPAKDSNCSVSQDILAKAMKAAQMSNSDCEVSVDFSTCGKFSSTNPGTGQHQEVTTVSSLDQGEGTPVATILKNTPEPIPTMSWSREEDQLILDKIKTLGLSDEVFEILSNQMSGKTPSQIRDRIVELLTTTR